MNKKAFMIMTMLICAGIYLIIDRQIRAQTQVDMNSDAYQAYQQSDQKLNKVYKRILAEYKNDKNFLSKLKIAEAAWIKFRDAHAESIYPETDKQQYYGSIFPVCYYSVLKTLTDERIRQLQVWLDGIEEGDACSGSVKIK